MLHHPSVYEIASTLHHLLCDDFAQWLGWSILPEEGVNAQVAHLSEDEGGRFSSILLGQQTVYCSFEPQISF
jgi:hypothetical protein